jgi:hypothetical protein
MSTSPTAPCTCGGCLLATVSGGGGGGAVTTWVPVGQEWGMAPVGGPYAVALVALWNGIPDEDIERTLRYDQPRWDEERVAAIAALIRQARREVGP